MKFAKHFSRGNSHNGDQLNIEKNRDKGLLDSHNVQEDIKQLNATGN